MQTFSIRKGDLLFSDSKIGKEVELKLLSAKNRDQKAYHNLGIISFNKGKIYESVNYFVRCLEIDPYYKSAILNLFEVLKFSKRYHLFVPILNKFLDKYHDDQDVKNILLEINNDIYEKQNIDDLFECEQNHPVYLYKELKQVQELKIIKIKNLLASLKQKEYQVNKPYRNVILTGIPGSGVELFESLLNKIDNVFNTNLEITDISSIPQALVDIRKCIFEESKRFNSKNFNLKNKIDEDIIVTFRLNLLYLVMNEIQGLKKGEFNQLIDFGYRIIAIVRDPVYTIANWNKLEFANMPEAMITDDNLSPRWNGIRFPSSNKLTRQAQLWNDYAKLFINLKNYIKIYTYEQIALNFEWVLKDLCNHLTLLNPQLQVTIENLNLRSKYAEIDNIKKAVDQCCPAKNVFGYTNAGAEGFVPPDLSEREKIVSSGEVDFQKIINRWKSGQPLTDN